MQCPFCQSPDSRVVDSRDVDGAIRRRRECLSPDCGLRFTTHERVLEVALYIEKKDGRREEFSREKLLAGLRKACEKRPLARGEVEAAAADLEADLYQLGMAEVPSTTVGEMVMARLRDLDPVAYVRFASVYRQFADLDQFKEELEAVLTGAAPSQAQLRLGGSDFSPTSLRLRPAAPNHGTRTRRPVRPVQTPIPITGESAPREPSKRKRKA